MAFQPPSSRQEQANRKLLEELQMKKQLLLKQGVSQTLTVPSITPLSVSTPVISGLTPEAHMMSPAQRVALQHAHSQSFGYFITQDSSFGNQILPVLPRFDSK